MLLLYLPPLAAIPLHGVIQLVSNGSRTVVQRRHARFDWIVWYALPLIPAGLVGLSVAKAMPEALLEAGRERLRPILMTVGTTVLGLLPLCIGTTQIGGDGPPYFPMARAIVGGLLFSTFVSLVLLPTIYTWLDIVRHWPAKLFHFLAAFLARMGRATGRLLWWPVRRLRKA